MEGTVAVLDDERVGEAAGTAAPAPTSTGCGSSTTRSRGVPASALAVPRILEVAEVGRTDDHRAGRGCTGGAGRARTPAPVRRGAGRRSRGVAVHPDMAVLPVPDGEAPFDPAVPFAGSLADLVERRAALLTGHVGAQTVVERSPPTCAARSRRRHRALVHGDLGPGNVLAVDGRRRRAARLRLRLDRRRPGVRRRRGRRPAADMFGPGAAAATTARSTRLTTEPGSATTRAAGRRSTARRTGWSRPAVLPAIPATTSIRASRCEFGAWAEPVSRGGCRRTSRWRR